MTAPLAARILVALGAAIALAGLIGGSYGPRPLSHYNMTIDAGNAAGVAVIFFSISSNGHLNVTIDGARQVFYVENLTGDPVTVLRALSVFNIRIGQANMVHDVRSGLIRGYATVEAEERLLQALPVLARVLHLSIESANTSGGEAGIQANLRAATGVVIVATPENQTLQVNAVYRLEGYEKLTPTQATLLGATLAGLGAFYTWASGRRVTQEAAIRFMGREAPTQNYEQ